MTVKIANMMLRYNRQEKLLVVLVRFPQVYRIITYVVLVS